MTLNDSWGYHKADDNWKTPKTIVNNLVTCANGGGNYLLNIGPKPDGSIPEESVAILTAGRQVARPQRNRRLRNRALELQPARLRQLHPARQYGLRAHRKLARRHPGGKVVDVLSAAQRSLLRRLPHESKVGEATRRRQAGNLRAGRSVFAAHGASGGCSRSTRDGHSNRVRRRTGDGPHVRKEEPASVQGRDRGMRGQKRGANPRPDEQKSLSERSMPHRPTLSPKNGEKGSAPSAGIVAYIVAY